MGLSNEERLEKIYFSLWRMTQADRLKRLRRTYDYDELVKLLENLWPAFLGSSGNGLCWLLGSGDTNEVMDKPTLFSIAICGNRSRGVKDSLEEMAEERRKEVEALPESDERKKQLERMDLCDYQCNYHPELEGILRRNAPELADVYAIYQDCENIRYALNRYRDDFAQQGEELASLVANILGACFNIFTTDSRVREAWYTQQIANRAVYQRIDPEDTVVKIWRQGGLHHSVGIGVHGLDELHDYWAKKIQPKQKLSTEERVLATLWLLKRRFHYEHQLKDMLKLLKQHNKQNPKDRVSLTKVEQMFRKHNAPAHEDYEGRSSSTVEYCRLAEQTVARNWEQPKPKKKGKKK